MDRPREHNILTQMDSIVESRTAWLVAILLLAGFVIRCALASIPELNFDEGFTYLIARQDTALETWKQFQTTAHPPLLYFLTRFWTSFGTSELFVRILPVLTGVMAVFMMYKWMYRLFRLRSAALVALAFGAFSPFLIALSIELRQYPVLFLFVFWSLYSFECRRYWWSACLCGAAILTHYSAIFLLPYFPVQLLIRQRLEGRWDGREFLRVCLPLALPVAIFAALYLIQVRTFSAREMTRSAKEDWLASGYRNPARESVPDFVRSRVVKIVREQYSLPIVSVVKDGRIVGWRIILATVVLIGVGLMAYRGLNGAAALTLLVYAAGAATIFVVAAVVAIAGFYPLSPTRHTSILIIVTLPIVCLLISKLCRDRAAMSLGLSLAIMFGLLLFRGTLKPMIHRETRIGGMARLAEVLKANARPGEPVFSDYGSALVMQYYLQRSPVTIDFFDQPPGHFHDYSWNGTHVISTSAQIFSTVDFFFDQLDELRRQRDLGPSILVVSAGMARPLEPGVDSSPRGPIQAILRAPSNPEVFRMELRPAAVAASQ